MLVYKPKTCFVFIFKSQNEMSRILQKDDIQCGPYQTALYLSLHSLLRLAYSNINGKYSKTCVKWPISKRPKLVFKTNISHNAGQKYCRMQNEILWTFNKLPFVIKIFILSIFEWLFYTGFTVPTLLTTT